MTNFFVAVAGWLIRSPREVDLAPPHGSSRTDANFGWLGRTAAVAYTGACPTNRTSILARWT
jgi:hypothetical protein